MVTIVTTTTGAKRTMACGARGTRVDPGAPWTRWRARTRATVYWITTWPGLRTAVTVSIRPSARVSR
jgi:hypothetical protein